MITRLVVVPALLALLLVGAVRELACVASELRATDAASPRPVHVDPVQPELPMGWELELDGPAVGGPVLTR